MNFVQPIRSKKKIEAIKADLRAKSERNYLLFVAGINTGLRISDLLKLRVRDVDGLHLVIKEQKTKKRRWIKITPDLRREFNAYIKGRPSGEYLFQSRVGKNRPITASMAYRIMAAVARKHGLIDIGTHSMRKTFGWHFYRKTKNVALLQNILGHSHPAITLRYIGVDQDERDAAMEDFNI